MKVFRILLMLAFLLVGLVIGALNSQPILIDFAFSSIATTSGIAIIVSLLAGSADRWRLRPGGHGGSPFSKAAPGQQAGRGCARGDPDGGRAAPP